MQVEQVLETYFMNLDNTYNKLQTLAEYVDDTEDYIKFEIDTQRNRFIEVNTCLMQSIYSTASHCQLLVHGLSLSCRVHMLAYSGSAL